MTHQLDPVLKALGSNSLKVWCFQAVGFKISTRTPPYAELKVVHEKLNKFEYLLKRKSNTLKHFLRFGAVQTTTRAFESALVSNFQPMMRKVLSN